MKPSLTVRLGNLTLKNPVITCSGTFGSGQEFDRFFDVSMLGAVTTKSYSLLKRAGNPPPRLFETKCGLINSIGLQNEGIDYFLENDLPFLSKKQADIILSIFGEDIKEFIDITKKIKRIEKDLKAIELNLSCPNIKEGGEAFCHDPRTVGEIVSGCRFIIDAPIIVKLSPNTDRSMDSALSSKENGADAVSFINTLVATAVDIDKTKFILGNKTGGLSGPAIKPVALAKVYQFCKSDILPVIGMGGISDYKDAIEFLMVGAKAIGVGTANFVQPMTAEEVLLGIRHFLKNKDFDDINQIIGVLLDED